MPAALKPFRKFLPILQGHRGTWNSHSESAKFPTNKKIPQIPGIKSGTASSATIN